MQARGGGELRESISHLSARPRVGIQPDGKVRHVRPLRMGTFDMQAAPECGERTLPLMHGQEGRRGKTLQPADLDVEGSEPLRLQGRHLRDDQVMVELVLRRCARLCRKAAQGEGDVRLSLVSVEQQAIKRLLCSSDARTHRRRINVERPQHIVRTPKVPLRKVAAFVSQRQGVGEEALAKRGELGHRTENGQGGAFEPVVRSAECNQVHFRILTNVTWLVDLLADTRPRQL